MSQQEGPEGTPGEVLSCASLREAKISEDSRPTSIAQLAVPASQALSPSLRGVLFIPSKHHVSSMGLASAHTSVSADITLPISPSPWKQQETAAHHQKFFGAFLSMES